METYERTVALYEALELVEDIGGWMPPEVKRRYDAELRRLDAEMQALRDAYARQTGEDPMEIESYPPDQAWARRELERQGVFERIGVRMLLLDEPYPGQLPGFRAV